MYQGPTATTRKNDTFEELKGGLGKEQEEKRGQRRAEVRFQKVLPDIGIFGKVLYHVAYLGSSSLQTRHLRCFLEQTQARHLWMAFLKGRGCLAREN